MYQITRKNRIKEQLQLCNADGSVACELEVDLNVDEITNRVAKAYDTLGMAQLELQKDPADPKYMEAYGKAVFSLLDIIFGESGREKILNFYEGNYSEMLLDIFPFLNDEIMPKIREASEARKQQLVEAARSVDKARKRR